MIDKKNIASTKKTPLDKPNKQDKQIESAKAEKVKADSERYAKISLSASHMHAILGESFTSAILPKAGIEQVVSELNGKIDTIQAGDMTSIEAMLVGQAHVLQTMFVTLGRMATTKTQLAQYTAFMNLALKAQSQSRATIQALVELKFPKQTNFVKQANIANGHQQINNNEPTVHTKETSTRAPAHAPAKEINNQPNELLEVNNGNKTMDDRTTQTTIPKDKAMATMATQHRGNYR